MNIILLHILLLILSDSTDQHEVPKVFKERIETELQSIYEAESYNFEFMVQQNDASLYRINVDSSQMGYLVITNSMGRFEPFTYMIAYNLDVSVQKIKILQYNSSRGTGVTSKRWLKQFVGNNGEQLRYGKDIQAISGATYSATSLTNDVPTVTQWVKKQVTASPQ